MPEPDPWSLEPSELLKQFNSSENGLTTYETRKRLEAYGSNTIPDKDKKTWIEILVSQFTNPLVLILIFASIISAFLGEVFDTTIIVVIVVISALLGFFQEYKSERVLSELKKYVSYRVSVIRNGQKIQVDSKEIVPGDMVTVGLGDIVPADLRVIETNGIFVDESVLTGESRAVEKFSKKLSITASTPQEISNGLFMGTTVVDGYAKAIVVATGQKTFFGKTASIFSSKVPESDFQIGIRKFGNSLVKIISVITAIVFISNYLLNHGENPFIDSLLFALAIAIGIAPEALPIVMTITLSSGSLALAKKKVITKKLAAIEDLGNMNVFCTDKTGTLTEDLQVDRYVDLDRNDSHDVLQYAVLCNAAVGTTKFRGNSVDVAIRRHGKAAHADISHFKKIQEIPFDFVRRRMGQVVQQGSSRVLIIKGAPESVLDVCSKIKISGKEFPVKKKIDEVKKMIAEYNLEGYSTISVAYKDIESKKLYSKNDESNLIFIGFILLKNPPKISVRPTLERLNSLNVGLKILTGDDALVTKKLCKDLNLGITEDRVILGNEIKNMSEQELSKIVEKYNVFARVAPDQKLAIIEALRKNGHVVGFLGDGINDAPSLRTADVGISVDTAADVAKGASHIILLEKDLHVICDGVEGGRKIFGNIMKYILNTMSANQGNMITVALSSFFLPFIPLLPSQILLNNLLSDIPLMSVASDNVDGIQTKKPRKWNIDFIVKFMLFFGAISTIFDLIFIIITYFFMHLEMGVFRTAWFLESVLSEMIIVFSLRTHLPFYKSRPSNLLIFASVVIIALSVGIVYFDPIAVPFRFAPLDADVLSFMAILLIGYFITTEIGKKVFYSKFAKIQ